MFHNPRGTLMGNAQTCDIPLKGDSAPPKYDDTAPKPKAAGTVLTKFDGRQFFLWPPPEVKCYWAVQWPALVAACGPETLQGCSLKIEALPSKPWPWRASILKVKSVEVLRDDKHDKYEASVVSHKMDMLDTLAKNYKGYAHLRERRAELGAEFDALARNIFVEHGKRPRCELGAQSTTKRTKWLPEPALKGCREAHLIDVGNNSLTQGSGVTRGRVMVAMAVDPEWTYEEFVAAVAAKGLKADAKHKVSFCSGTHTALWMDLGEYTYKTYIQNSEERVVSMRATLQK